MEDYKKIYEDFWKDIVENKDGSLNKDQIMRELADFFIVMDNCAKAYDVMTQGVISKQCTDFEAVRRLFYENYIDREMAKDDLVENVLCKEMTYEEIIEAIENYFD